MKLNDWKGNAVQIQGDRTYQSRGQCSCGGEFESVIMCDRDQEECAEGECSSYYSGECKRNELWETLRCKKCGVCKEA